MKAQTYYVLDGHLKQKVQVPLKIYYNAESLFGVLDGYLLDEIRLGCVITSKEEVDHLIKFLMNARDCFFDEGVKAAELPDPNPFGRTDFNPSL